MENLLVYKNRNTIKITQQKSFDYFLVAWLILISGSPSLRLIPGTTYLTGIFGILYCIILNKPQYIIKVIPSLIFFLLIFIGQFLTLNYLPIKYPAGFLIMIVAGSFVYQKVGQNFRYIYFKVIYFFSLVSLIFWVIQNTVGITFDLFSIAGIRSILIWNVRTDPFNISLYELRNSGPVWEPGAFAGYIILVFMLYIDNVLLLWKKFRFEVVTILIALLTTFSTTGYIIISLFFLYKTMFYTKGKVAKNFVGLLILIPGLYFLSKLDFIGNKLLVQFENAIASEGNVFSNTRIGALLFDLQYIQKNPLFGNGIDPKTRWSDHIDLYLDSINGKNLGHGNGFSGYIATMGILAIVFIVINIFITFKKYFSLIDTSFILLIFLLLLQTESYLTYPLLSCLYFIKFKKVNSIISYE